MNNCAFTIVAKNYIGLARILEQSINRVNDDVDFYIIVADEIDTDLEVPANVVIAKNSLEIPSSKWIEMSFKYDLTEFCTSIKPSCFKYLASKGYEKIIYFDPDIYVFSSLQPIFQNLTLHSIILTPHVAGIHNDYQGDLPENDILWNGTFNLGFCAMRNSIESRAIMDWWETRLFDRCFAEINSPLFFDQKWMEMLSGFFGSEVLLSTQNLGMNLAPWNYFEREIFTQNGEYMVRFRNEESSRIDKLIFAHFAGYNYNLLSQGVKKRLRLPVKSYQDIESLLKNYQDVLVNNQKDFSQYIELCYTYNYYDNGAKIEKFHRGLYRGLIDKKISTGNPFLSTKGSFYDSLKRRKMFSSNVQVEKYNKNTYSRYDKNRKILNTCLNIVYSIIGYEKYALLIRAMFTYSKVDQHTFLVEKFFPNQK